MLDMARAGLDLKGVVTFHGNLLAPLLNASFYADPSNKPEITAKILVLHGHDDTSIKPELVFVPFQLVLGFRVFTQDSRGVTPTYRYNRLMRHNSLKLRK